MSWAVIQKGRLVGAGNTPEKACEQAASSFYSRVIPGAVVRVNEVREPSSIAQEAFVLAPASESVLRLWELDDLLDEQVLIMDGVVGLVSERHQQLDLFNGSM